MTDPLLLTVASGLQAQAFEVASLRVIEQRSGATNIETTPGSLNQIYEMHIMIQALLAERFKLVSHRESREMSAYALVQTKSGHIMTASTAGDGSGVRPSQGRKLGLTGHIATMDRLAFFLSGPLGTPVLMQSALPKQLGLRPEGRRMPVELLVIDHIEKSPVEN